MSGQLELKPCPFCGRQPETMPWHGGGPHKTLIHCFAEYRDECAVGPGVTGATPKEAAALWNKRVNETRADRLAGELAEAERLLQRQVDKCPICRGMGTLPLSPGAFNTEPPECEACKAERTFLDREHGR